MTKLFLIILGISTSITVSTNAFAGIKYSDAQVCRNLSRVKAPPSIHAEECYDQAKRYLKSKDIKIMTGSYQAYFALSAKDPSQNNCRPFLKNMVTATQKAELADAKDIFGDDKAYSLDRSFYSYQTCLDAKLSKNQTIAQGNNKLISKATMKKKTRRARTKTNKAMVAQKQKEASAQAPAQAITVQAQTQSTPTLIQSITPSRQSAVTQGAR